MTSIAAESTSVFTSRLSARKLALTLLIVLMLVSMTRLSSRFSALSLDDELLVDSTLGELAIWMAEQTEEDEIVSLMARYAESWAQSIGQDSLEPEILLATARNTLVIWTLMIILGGIASLLSYFVLPAWTQRFLLITLVGALALIFVVPVIAGDSAQIWVIAAVILLLAALLMNGGKVSRVAGFIIALSSLFVVWETSKAFASSVNNKIALPQPGWEYRVYATVNEALDTLSAGEVDAVILDRRSLSEFMVAHTEDASLDPDSLPYPQLRYVAGLAPGTVALFPLEPEFSGRLAVAVAAGHAQELQSVNDLNSLMLASVEGEFAETNYLAAERQLVLVDLKVLNDLNLPHIQNIAEALLQPARRNGSQLMLGILANAAGYTWGEALFGFLIGAALGLVLGTGFAHSRLMERSLLPYVVASQTVPILAIAPMVVIWLGPSQFSVSVIAAYLTFFPVTINTLRGLQSPKPSEVELLQSYAASRWAILWKLRFPAALPFIFTALKVSATASVVGAIIGELPSGIGDGLGRAILNFSSDYSLVSTPKLWASILMAASVGITFFVIVSLVEQLVLGRYLRRT